jgi:tyrosyl-tRNA synthetase
MGGIEDQIETLLRGTLYADEVAGRNAGADIGAVGGRTLREQMTAELQERLKEGRPLRVYLGVDPTSTDLHVGHFVPIHKLRQFQELGHRVIFLIGDYTATVGDPSDQQTERKRLSHDQVLELGKTYAEQAFHLLDPKQTEIRKNGEWLSKLTFADILELASILPLKWVISRRDFKDRLDRGESLRLHETLYALMQGYDAYALHCDVQVGGYDQHFNMLAGRWIQEHFAEKPHVMITLPLLVGTDGRKMSKSYGNAIHIHNTPEDMYGKTMRIADESIIEFFELTTTYTGSEVAAFKTRLNKRDVNPMAIKKELAEHLVTLYHGEDAAKKASEHFRQVVQQKSVPEAVETVILSPEIIMGTTWVDILVSCNLVKSKSEMRRLIEQGGFYVEQEQVRDLAAKWDGSSSTVIRLGKRRYLRIVSQGRSI